MTSDLCEDVVVRLSSPQIISSETIVPAPGNVGGRIQTGGVELGRRLLLAARAGDTTTVLDLMAKGAPFTTDWLGTSPLHLAAANNHAETCAVLLRAGVSRDARTKVERTPLHLAAHAGHAPVVALLLDHGAMVDCRDMLHMTPLHWAGARGHAAVARELLARGADVRARCKFRKTPRCLAARAAAADVLALLDRALADRGSCSRGRPSGDDDPAGADARLAIADRSAASTRESPKPQSFETVQRLQEIKTQTETKHPEKTIIIESKAEAAGGAAALLRAHGITLLPRDRGSTVLSALRSGRTVVLSDAGKLMLKESTNTGIGAGSNASIVDASTLTADLTNANVVNASANLSSTNITNSNTANDTNVSSNLLSSANVSTANRGVMVRARTVKTLKGVKGLQMLSVNKPEQTIKKVINPHDLQQVKLLGVKENKSPRPRPALKILLNKANLTRLLANTSTPTTNTQLSIQPPSECPESLATAEEASPASLRAQLQQAHTAIANLAAELRLCKAKLAKYEGQTHS